MRLRNKLLSLGLLSLGLILFAVAQNPPPPNNPPASDADKAAPAPPPPAAGQQSGQQDVERGENGTFTFKKKVEEVVLHATVTDQRQHLVSGLRQGDFAVFEDGKPMVITSFHQEDIPVSIGIVIDNSGSMRDKRQKVNQAALNLVRASNPQDELFVVNFNDEYYLDQDFTSNINQLKEGLDHIESRGGTALYDAVVASADHLAKGARLDRKVLLVVTDGEDNASRESLEQALRRLQEQNGPTIYTIGLLSEEHGKRARRALREMAEDTGGVAYFPKDLNEVEAITQQIAHDIRNQYTLAYYSTNARKDGTFRNVRVDAFASGNHSKLAVRTRPGYYAPKLNATTASASGQ